MALTAASGQSNPFDGDAQLSARHPERRLGEGAADCHGHDPVFCWPLYNFLVWNAPRKWQQGSDK